MIHFRTSARFARAFGALLLAAGASTSVMVRRGHTSSAGNPVRSDNSRQNVAPARTAEDQPNDRDDRLTAAHVRRTIVQDKTLSVYAHNVKIIVADGHVTLIGPVHSDEERQEVAFDAAAIVGPRAVVNKLTVA